MSPKYPLIEIFYSLKGEGLYTGTPMLFVRLAGCNLACDFCDTPSKKTMELEVADIITRLGYLSETCDRVVITGGEPNIHDLSHLCEALHYEGYNIHMETNGEETHYLGTNLVYIDWLAVSPKSLEVSQVALNRADEIKFLVGQTGWETGIWILENRLIVNRPHLYVMPLAEAYANGYGRNNVIKTNTQDAIQFCKEHPQFSLCIQAHKYLNIP